MKSDREDCVGHHLESSKELSEEIRAYDLVKSLGGVFSGLMYVNELPWIVNLDLDYFFRRRRRSWSCLVRSVEGVAKAIKLGLDSGMVEVLTISLSPECCGSWEKAERMLSKFGGTL